MKSTRLLNDAVERLQAARQAKAAQRQAEQPGLFDTDSDTPETPLSSEEVAAALPATGVEIRASNTKRERAKLLPVRHVERDFFLCDMFDYAMKDDGASMEAPIFTLSTKVDLSTWEWESKDGNRRIEVYPSVKGRATQFDKDVLIYVISQMTEGLNRDRADSKNRIMRFTVYDYLVTTNKAIGGYEYVRLEAALDRLYGTTIKTDIRTGGERVKRPFRIIDDWKIVEKSETDERMIAIEIKLSEWLYNAVQAHEVLTINRDYFRLRKPLERRLYELARKHCGHQSMWSIGLELLQEKAGSKCSLREFRRMVREIIESDTLLDYRFILAADDKVTFYTKDTRKLIARLAT